MVRGEEVLHAGIHRHPRDSRRIDVPKDHVPPQERRKDWMSYFDTDDPETKDINPVIKLVDEVLAGKK